MDMFFCCASASISPGKSAFVARVTIGIELAILSSKKLIITVMLKINNNFIKNAPIELVEEERKRLEDAKEKLKKLKRDYGRILL